MAHGTLNSTKPAIVWHGSATGDATWLNPREDSSVQTELPQGSAKACTDRVTRIFHSDTCGGTVVAPGCGKDECCKSAGLGAHCFCDICD
eukprot:5205980-Prymnesium_polylepis.1